MVEASSGKYGEGRKHHEYARAPRHTERRYESTLDIENIQE
jgi:hypothetical protein